MGLGIDDDCDEPVLECVVAKNVSDFRRDDGLETVIEQRPGRMLAGRATAEVIASYEYRATAGFRTVTAAR